MPTAKERGCKAGMPLSLVKFVLPAETCLKMYSVLRNYIFSHFYKILNKKILKTKTCKFYINN